MKRPTAIFLALISLVHPAYGLALDYSAFTCSRALRDKMRLFSPSSDWTRQASITGGLTYRTSTSIFGQWLEIRTLPTQLIVLSSSEALQFTWIGSQCREEKKILPSPKKIEGQNTFTDGDLQKLMETHSQGLIYIWSPGMVYSMERFETFKRVSEKMDLHLTALMDPYFDEDEGERIAKKFSMPFFSTKVESIELLMRDFGTHYPQTLVYKNRTLSKEKIVGAMTPSVLETEIRNSLKKL